MMSVASDNPVYQEMQKSMYNTQVSIQTLATQIGLKPGIQHAAAGRVLILPKGTVFVCDTHVTRDPRVAEHSNMSTTGKPNLSA